MADNNEEKEKKKEEEKEKSFCIKIRSSGTIKEVPRTDQTFRQLLATLDLPGFDLNNKNIVAYTSPKEFSMNFGEILQTYEQGHTTRNPWRLEESFDDFAKQMLKDLLCVIVELQQGINSCRITVT